MTRPTTDEDQSRDRRRLLIRVASAVAAVALVVALVLVLLAGRTDTPPSPEAFCGRIGAVAALGDALAAGDASQIADATRQLRRAAAVAPPEIASQMQVMVTYADGLSDRVADAEDDPDAMRAALEDALRSQNDQVAAVNDAGAAVQYYTQAICGIDVTKMTGTTGPADGTGDTSGPGDTGSG